MTLPSLKKYLLCCREDPSLCRRGPSGVVSFLTDAGEGGTAGTIGAVGGGTRFNASRLTSCPEGLLIEIIFPGINAPALALRDVGRLAAEGVEGGEGTEGGG